MGKAGITDFPPIMVVEPGAQQGKRRAASILLRKERPPDIGALKARLREMRGLARDNRASLLDTLKKTLTRYPRVQLTTAADAREAAAYIRALAPDRGLASLNKSTVVVNELRPELTSMGFTTHIRYFSEFDSLADENLPRQVEDYWSLPGMHDRGLVETFTRQGINGPATPGARRDYLAILGVNAVSAAEGTVFFLQHMANISKDLEQARQVVLVITPEKILPDCEEALLHTQSMGVFGLEAMFLDLLPEDGQRFDFDSLPVLPDGLDQEIHVLILDNGRSTLPENAFRDLWLCIDCRACARQCPVGRHLPASGLIYSPKNTLLGYLQGAPPSLEACLHCGRCHVECPLEIDLPALFWKAQFARYDREGRSWKRRMLDDPELLAKFGSRTAPLSNWTLRIPPVKALMEMVAGIHRAAPLPAFQRRTFRDGRKKSG